MKVSVIVCTYSPKMMDHFLECIRSLVNQSYPSVEIVCIVDGNEDYYKRLVKDMDDKLKSKITLHLNERNLGLLESRNIGVKLADGDVVAFIDDDAIADRRWIEELVKMYRKGAIAVGGKIMPLWLSKRPRWLPEEFYWMIGVTHLGFPEDVREVRNTFGSNLSFKRDVFLELGGFNPAMGGIKGSRILQGGETELCNRMRKRYGRGVVYNPNAIVYHKIFERRTRFRFLVRRAFWQGYSKAIMKGLTGDIREEKNFLKYLLAERTRARVVEAARGSIDDILKLLFMWIFLSFVGLGYVYGNLTKLTR